MKTTKHENVFDFDRVYGMEITTAKGQTFSRKRYEMENGETNFEYFCYLGKFYPVYAKEGLFFRVEYKGQVIDIHPEDDTLLTDLMSNDADVLKKAINKVYQTAKHMWGIEKYGNK